MKRSPLQDAIAEVLHQGESLLNSLRDGEYTRKLPTAFGSTVGGHYRHCLDHFQSLLQGLDADEINYDHRDRNPRIENDRNFALAETQRILRGFASMSTPYLDCPIKVRSKVNYELDAAPSMQSLGLENSAHRQREDISGDGRVDVVCLEKRRPVEDVVAGEIENERERCGGI